MKNKGSRTKKYVYDPEKKSFQVHTKMRVFNDFSQGECQKTALRGIKHAECYESQGGEGGGGGWKVDDFEAFGMLFKNRC